MHFQIFKLLSLISALNCGLIFFTLYPFQMKKTNRLIIIHWLCLVLLIHNGFSGFSQTGVSDSSHLNKTKFWVVAGTHTALWAGSYIALDKAWYSDYPKEHFHFFNDNKEWNQMDKWGHVWTAYQISSLSTEMWRWTGLKNKTSVWLGGASAIAYQGVIEIQDGFSKEWGFSWGDIGANTLGAGAYVAQELCWGEQRIQVKLSYWPYDYPDEFIQRRNNLFGNSMPERFLKDYNSQTYWISANLHSFWKQSRIPKWLNVSFGYSADLMVGGMANSWTDKDGTIHNYSYIPRTRHYYLSPDVDFSKIKTNSKLLRGVFFALNMIKVPAPTLEFSKGKFRFRALYF